MMTRKTRNGLILLGALSMLSYWASSGRDNERRQPIAGLDTRLDYALKDFQVRYFDEHGNPSMKLRSPSFSSDAATGEGRVTQPVIEVRHGGFLWHIIADAATVTDDKELIFLSGGVNIRRHGNEPDSWLVINTEEVTLEVTPQVASSDYFVEIIDISSTLEATGFSVNMQNNHFKLKNKVKGTYVIN